MNAYDLRSAVDIRIRPRCEPQNNHKITGLAGYETIEREFGKQYQKRAFCTVSIS